MYLNSLDQILGFEEKTEAWSSREQEEMQGC